MRNRALVLIFCLSSSLLGCSSKPSTSDIAAGLNEYWGTCAKAFDINKTNGIEDGKTYQVAFTYKLELLENGEPPSCSLAGGASSQFGTLLKIIVSSGSRDHVKKGDVFTVTNELTNMVKSEKGWIFQ